MPAYKVFPYKGFSGGLNLRDSPDVVTEDQAVDLLNVLFVARGSVEQRTGYAQFTAAAGTNRYDSLTAFYKSDGTRQVVAGAGHRLEAMNAAGAILASTAAPTSSPHFFARFGGPTAEHVYISNGTDPLRRWTGTVFETPAFTGITPNGKFLGLSTTDNRLVCARFTGVVEGNNPSTVRFSSEGNPLDWPDTNFVDLEPGDGEEIMGVASWRDLVIVFKQTKFFVFYGQSVDDDGQTIFNRRPVDSGAGLAASRALAVAEQGVYFMDRTGIFFTDGSDPQRVSDVVGTVFTGGSSLYYTSGELNDGSIAEASLVYHDTRLWFSFPAGTSAVNSRQLVFDPFEKWWSLTDLPAGPMTNFRTADRQELLFGYSSGTNHIGRWRYLAYAADNMDHSGAGGQAISSFWQGGWFDYATPAVKRIREYKIAGTGVVSVSILHDYRQTIPFTLAVILSPTGSLWDVALWDAVTALWGPASVESVKLLRRAVRGEAFSLRLSNNTFGRGFKIHAFTTHVAEARVPSVTSVD